MMLRFYYLGVSRQEAEQAFATRFFCKHKKELIQVALCFTQILHQTLKFNLRRGCKGFGSFVSSFSEQKTVAQRSPQQPARHTQKTATHILLRLLPHKILVANKIKKLKSECFRGLILSI